MPNIIVLSDTHWSQPEAYSPKLGTICEGADLIVHAGDAVESFVLEWLQASAPVHAVVGNCDRRGVRAKWPGLQEFESGGVRFGLLHGHHVNLRDPAAIVGCFSAEVRFIIHGHTHLAAHYEYQGVQIFNPGSLSEPRDERGPSYGKLRVENGIVSATHLPFSDL